MEKYVVCTIINKHCRLAEKPPEFSNPYPEHSLLKFPSYESNFLIEIPYLRNISTLNVAKPQKLFSILPHLQRKSMSVNFFSRNPLSTEHQHWADLKVVKYQKLSLISYLKKLKSTTSFNFFALHNTSFEVGE